tara:strand:- start:479 stop:700 length:222 start_codon:yes stop_codon:yes gene_type:complete
LTSIKHAGQYYRPLPDNISQYDNPIMRHYSTMQLYDHTVTRRKKEASPGCFKDTEKALKPDSGALEQALEEGK